MRNTCLYKHKYSTVPQDALVSHVLEADMGVLVNWEEASRLGLTFLSRYRKKD